MPLSNAIFFRRSFLQNSCALQTSSFCTELLSTELQNIVLRMSSRCQIEDWVFPTCLRVCIFVLSYMLSSEWNTFPSALKEAFFFGDDIKALTVYVSIFIGLCSTVKHLWSPNYSCTALWTGWTGAIHWPLLATSFTARCKNKQTDWLISRSTGFSQFLHIQKNYHILDKTLA